MLRAVIDTNLIVSYLLTQGQTISQIVGHWEEGNFVYLVSPAIIEELKDVLNRPRLRRYMTADPNVLLDIIENDAEHTEGELSLTGVCRDPKDDMFIACAAEGNADYIVTGDADLLDLVQYDGIRILRPREFADVLDAQLR